MSNKVRLAIAASLATASFAMAITPATALADYRGYSDIPANHWAVTEGVIDWSENHHVVNGMGNGTWGLGNTITRAQAAQMIYNLAGRPAVTARPQFTDSATFDWAEDAIAWASTMGIFTGYENPNGLPTFDPGAPLTREQAAKVLRMVSRSRSGNTGILSNYPDAGSVSSWATGSVAWAVENNIMGKGGFLSGNAPCSRVEFVSMLKSTDDTVHFNDDDHYWDDRFEDFDDDRFDDDWDDNWDDDDRFDDDDWDDDDRFDDDDDDRFDDDDDGWDDDRFDDDWDDDDDRDDDWDDDRDDDDDDDWDD